MRLKISEKVLNYAELLAVGFLILMSLSAVEAQNTTATPNCRQVYETTLELVPGYVDSQEYNPVTKQTETRQVYKSVLKPVGKWVTRCGPSSGEVSDTPKNSTKPDISSTIAAQPAPADSPMLGKWKYVECVNNDCNVKSIEVVKMAPIILRTSTFNYLQNGVVESFHKLTNIIEPILAKGSWKYTPQNASSGILEEHNGEDLVESGSVKFLNQNKLEYTITFSPNSATIGKKVIWERISSPPKSENNQPTPLPRPLVNPKDELRDKHLKEADRLMQPESYIKAIEYYSR